MSEGVHHSTFVIERTYSSTAARVFAALSDPMKKRRWFLDGEGFEFESFEMDFRVGGFERSRFRLGAGTPLPAGTVCANDTVFMDIVPDRRIVLAYSMMVAGNRISSSQATFELVPAGQGTKLIFTEQAAFFPGADGPRIREDGWRELLDRLDAELGSGA